MKFQLRYLPFYILITSLFVGSFVIQYCALALFLVFYLINKPKVELNKLTLLALLLTVCAILSFWFNFLQGNADGFSIFFWLLSYLPPFILCLALAGYGSQIEFQPVYSFYKKLVYVQSFLLLYTAIDKQTLVVGDAATGTVGDANWVAFHICFVLIHEIVRTVELARNKSSSQVNLFKSVLEIFYFLVILIIPESTANLGFMTIIVAMLFAMEFLHIYRHPIKFLFFTLISIVGMVIVVNTTVFDRIRNAAHDLTSEQLDSNPYLFKISMYKEIATGKIYSDANFFIGSGPSTFTSRSSVVRMPEERTNEVPIELPYFKSEIFNKYISMQYARWRSSGESYGNFASPQTTIISIAVELGIIGLVTFMVYFSTIINLLRNGDFRGTDFYLSKFGIYITIYFLMSLFHLNFWEYPLMSFTYIMFVFLTLRQRKVSR